MISVLWIASLLMFAGAGAFLNLPY